MNKPFVRIDPERKRAARTARPARVDRALAADRRGSARSASVTFSNEPPGTYERIFGKTEEQRQQEWLEAVAKQKAEKAARLEEAGAAPAGVAVAGENKGAGRRLYGSPHKGVFDWGLGQQTYGRSDRARKMQVAGLKERH